MAAPSLDAASVRARCAQLAEAILASTDAQKAQAVLRGVEANARTLGYFSRLEGQLSSYLEAHLGFGKDRFPLSLLFPPWPKGPDYGRLDELWARLRAKFGVAIFCDGRAAFIGGAHPEVWGTHFARYEVAEDGTVFTTDNHVGAHFALSGEPLPHLD